VLLWEALAHRHPFGGGRFLEVAKRIGRGAPSLATARPDLPRALIALVDRALSVDPAKRPRADRLAAGLRSAWAGRDRHRRSLSVPDVRQLPQIGPALPPALLAGWTAATFPFFPAHWSAGLAALAALLSLVGPRLGLGFALAVPVLPLGNISLGLAIVYGIAACAWFALFWSRPRAALLFLAGPVLAAIGAIGLMPLAALPAGGPARRAAQTFVAVIAGGLVAGIGGHSLPIIGGATPELAIAGVPGPLAAASALWHGLVASHPFLLEAGALAAGAAALDACRRRGPWGAATFGAVLMTLTLLAAPAAPALPLVGAAWLSALLLAGERGPRRPAPELVRRIRLFRPRRVRLRVVGGR
jgi:hypothetical protein